MSIGSPISRLLATAASVLLVVGCTRVVDIDVPEGPEWLVVDGRVEYGEATQRVRLTTTDLFSSPTAPPSAIGAVVEVTDELGGRYPFPEVSDGIYVSTELVPRLDGRYTLTIEYEGERYLATTGMTAGPPIDSLYFTYVEEGLAQGDSGFRAVIDYTDPPGVADYYLWELFVNGDRRITIDPGNRFRVISTDEFYDGGRVVGYQPFHEEVVNPGEVVRLRQIALSEEAYRYWFALYEQTAPGGGPFSTPPASLRGNVANVTSPEHRALGFFHAGQIAQRVATVPPR